eukprot:2129702-Ditylum_brightwellii.AAC.1
MCIRDRSRSPRMRFQLGARLPSVPPTHAHPVHPAGPPTPSPRVAAAGCLHCPRSTRRGAAARACGWAGILSPLPPAKFRKVHQRTSPTLPPLQLMGPALPSKRPGILSVLLILVAAT